MFRKFAIPVAMAVLVAGASAQTQAPQKHAINGPIHNGTYDFVNGFQPSPAGPVNRAVGPETLYDNTFDNIYYFSNVGVTEEWLDELAFEDPTNQGGVAALDPNRQVTGFLIEYCSFIDDANPSGSDVTNLTLRFYADHAPTVGPVNWPVADCEYVMGLPGNISGIPGGSLGFSCWSISADLAAGTTANPAGYNGNAGSAWTGTIAGGPFCTLPMELTPGGMEAVGVGYEYRDAAGILTAGPILDGILAGPNANSYGVADTFDLLDEALAFPAGRQDWLTNYAGSFFFGGGAKEQSNFSLILWGPPIDSSYGTAANPGSADTLCLTVGSRVMRGMPVQWEVTNPDPNSNYILILSRGTIGGAPLIAQGNGTLLVDWNLRLLNPIPMVPSQPGANPTAGFPAVPPAGPSIVHAQAIEYQGPNANPGASTAASNRVSHLLQ